MNCNKYSLLELCKMYVGLVVASWIGRLYEARLVNCIAEKSGLLYEEVRAVIHDLDKKVGSVVVSVEDFDEKMDKYGVQLYNCIMKVKNKRR